jgi:hypothetical protein
MRAAIRTALILLCALPLRAQSPDSIGRATLSVTGDSVAVVLDSSVIGTSPLHDLPIGAGRHTLKFLPASAALWHLPLYSETLLVRPRDTIARRADARFIRISSDPFGADIVWRDSVVGTTPFIGLLPAAGSTLVLRKAGYRDALLVVAGGSTEFRLPLQPVAGPGSEEGAATGYLSSDRSRNLLPVYVAGGVTVATGAVAAYFKIRADGLYDDYRSTGNTAQLDRVRQYDLVSGISLAASEVSFLALTYFLLSR